LVRRRGLTLPALIERPEAQRQHALEIVRAGGPRQGR
jgi:hypothetical protein